MKQIRQYQRVACVFSFIRVMTPVFSCGIVGVMVSALALHAEGMEFDPG